MSKKSEFVKRTRKENFDRVSVLIEKGGNFFLRALAIREGTSIAEFIRRAILARAGLRMLPYPEELDQLSDIETQKEAEYAISHFQRREVTDQSYADLVNSVSSEPTDCDYQISLSKDDAVAMQSMIARINADITTQELSGNDAGQEITLTITGDELAIVRRSLANLMKIFT